MQFGVTKSATGAALTVVCGLILAGCASVPEQQAQTAGDPTNNNGAKTGSANTPTACAGVESRIALSAPGDGVSGFFSAYDGERRRLGGTVESLYFLRQCLSALRSEDASDNTKKTKNIQDIGAVVDTIAGTYDQRVRRQGRWLGAFGYTSLVSTAGALAAPRSDWASLAAVPLLATQMEDYDSTRVLYSVGATSLGLTRAWYDDLRRWRSDYVAATAAELKPKIGSDEVDLEATCTGIQTLRSGLDSDSVVRADATALLQICNQLEESTSYFSSTKTILEQLGSEHEIARSLACDIVFMDRQLSQSDDRLRQSPSAAIGSVLSIVPTVIQGLVDGQKLQLQEAGRIQQVIGTLTVRMGSLPYSSLVSAPPALPERISPFADATVAGEHGDNMAQYRRDLMTVLAGHRRLRERATSLRTALQPVVLRYSYDPSKRTVEAIRISEQDAASPALQGC